MSLMFPTNCGIVLDGLSDDERPGGESPPLRSMALSKRYSTVPQ